MREKEDTFKQATRNHVLSGFKILLVSNVVSNTDKGAGKERKYQNTRELS